MGKYIEKAQQMLKALRIAHEAHEIGDDPFIVMKSDTELSSSLASPDRISQGSLEAARDEDEQRLEAIADQCDALEKKLIPLLTSEQAIRYQKLFHPSEDEMEAQWEEYVQAIEDADDELKDEVLESFESDTTKQVREAQKVLIGEVVPEAGQHLRKLLELSSDLQKIHENAFEEGQRVSFFSGLWDEEMGTAGLISLKFPESKIAPGSISTNIGVCLINLALKRLGLEIDDGHAGYKVLGHGDNIFIMRSGTPEPLDMNMLADELAGIDDDLRASRWQHTSSSKGMALKYISADDGYPTTDPVISVLEAQLCSDHLHDSKLKVGLERRGVILPMGSPELYDHLNSNEEYGLGGQYVAKIAGKQEVEALVSGCLGAQIPPPQRHRPQ